MITSPGTSPGRELAACETLAASKQPLICLDQLLTARRIIALFVAHLLIYRTCARIVREKTLHCHAVGTMLPVFNGADSVFRGILVPVFGLKAQLLRRDARVLAEESTKGLTEEQKAAVVASFNEGVAKKTN